MYNNYSQHPVYESQATVLSQQSAYSNSYEPIQYIQNLPTNQSIYSVPTQQQGPQFSSYPQHVDNSYVSQQSQPVYQATSQQPPPSYSAAVQSSYPTPVQQQPLPNNNPNSVSTNAKGQAAPFTSDYKWPRKSIDLTCPKCGAHVKTRVESSPTIITFLACAVLFFFTVLLACVPFCFRACKKSTHYCPYCNSMLGVRHELR